MTPALPSLSHPRSTLGSPAVATLFLSLSGDAFAGSEWDPAPVLRAAVARQQASPPGWPNRPWTAATTDPRATSLAERPAVAVSQLKGARPGRASTPNRTARWSARSPGATAVSSALPGLDAEIHLRAGSRTVAQIK